MNIPCTGKGTDERVGFDIVLAAMQEPFRCIVTNSGENPDLVLEQVLADDCFDFGYDALYDQCFEMVIAGILDPTKVVRTALQNAASVAGIMLTVETLVVDELEERRETVAGTEVPMQGTH